MVFSPLTIFSCSSAVSTPACFNAPAQATEPRTSCRARRLSKGREVLSTQAFWSSFVAKRPLHSVMSVSLETGIIGLGHVEPGNGQPVQRTDLHGESIQSDKTFGVTLVIYILLAEGGKV